MQHVPYRGPFRVRPGGVAPIAVQRADDRRAHVLGDHHVVAQVEGGGIDAAVQQLEGFGEVGAVVRRRPAIGQVHGHAMAPPGATGALPVVGGQRRHVAHQHGVEAADVDPELQRRGAHQAVHRAGVALEEVLQPLALVGRHHRGVLLGAQQRVGAVEKLQVVVVVVFGLPVEHAVAAPGQAAVVRRLAGGRAPAAPAPPRAAVGREPQTVGVHLVDAADVRQRAPPGPLESDRDQQPAVHQEGEQALQERRGVVGGRVPLAGDLPQGGLAGLAQPLDDQPGLLGGAAAQLGADRTAEDRQVALLNLAVALHPAAGTRSRCATAPRAAPRARRPRPALLRPARDRPRARPVPPASRLPLRVPRGREARRCPPREPAGRTATPPTPRSRSPRRPSSRSRPRRRRNAPRSSARPVDRRGRRWSPRSRCTSHGPGRSSRTRAGAG